MKDFAIQLHQSRVTIRGIAKLLQVSPPYRAGLDSKIRHTTHQCVGHPMIACSADPLTVFYRDGCCNTGDEDMGVHSVCIVATEEFLAFTKQAGNDLSTPMPEYRFAGLKAGDRWCLCASRWQEAYEAGAVPPVVLEATHARSLEFCDVEGMKKNVVSKSESV